MRRSELTPLLDVCCCQDILVAKHLLQGRVLSPRFEELVHRKPSIMCWGCGVLLIPRTSEVQQTAVESTAESPAEKAFGHMGFQATILRENENGTMMVVNVCYSCKQLNRKVKLQTVQFFLDFGSIPEEIGGLTGKQKALLSLAQLSASTFRPPRRMAYPHFRGSVHIHQYDGLFGTFVVSEKLKKMTDDEAEAVRAAVRLLKEINPLFASQSCVFETIVDYASNESVPTAFPTLPTSHLTLDDDKQKRVGDELEGMLIPIEDMPPEASLVPMSNLSAGNEFPRPNDTKQTGSSHGNLLFGDRNLEMKIFPWLYPRGTGGYHMDIFRDNRLFVLRPKHFVKARLLGPDSRFRDDYWWGFFWHDMLEKIRIHTAQRAMVSESTASHSGRTLTVDAVLKSKSVNRGAPTDADSDDVNPLFLPNSICGGKTYWCKILMNLYAMVREIGTPHLFLTLTADESGWSSEEHATMNKPVQNMVDFKRRFFTLLNFIRSGKIFGEVANFWYRLEYQQRGSPHIHMMIWLKDSSHLCSHVWSRVPDEKQVDFVCFGQY
jgi:hypothetical protein